MDYYVYVYFRLDGTPCYVGMGRGKRWLTHERRPTNRHLWNIIRNAGGSLPKVIVRSGLSVAEAAQTEIALIAVIGREAHNGPLVNLTDGGEGTRGCKQPKSAQHRAKIAAANKGKPFSSERRAAISAALTGRKVSPEFAAHLRSIRAKQKRPPCSAETREKIRVANTGKRPTAETRARMSAASLGRKKTPEHSAAISAGHRSRVEADGANIH